MSRMVRSIASKVSLSSLAAVGLALAGVAGCRIKRPGPDDPIVPYQKSLAAPQPRVDLEGRDTANPLGLLEHPETTPRGAQYEQTARGEDGEFHLTLEQAVTKVLSNSPEVRIVSLDASIAEQMTIKSEAELDPTAFGRLNTENKNVPTTAYSEVGASDVQMLESGVKQKIRTGGEWSFSYVLTRSWDDLVGRTPPRRFEPILAFQLKQPLLRDAFSQVALAGIDVAELNHRIALLAFRQKAEELATATITQYWQLVQAREDLVVQQQLLTMAMETYDKVDGRRAIDATDVQIQQAQVNVRTRKALFLQAELEVKDAQDSLARLMADPNMDLIGTYRIVPETPPIQSPSSLDDTVLVPLAIRGNPILQQARLGIRIAEINVTVAKNQRMPRLDLVASASTQSLSASVSAAHERLADHDYGSYAVGVVLEYPLGNRQAGAELERRRLEHRKAVATLQNLADQVAVQGRQRIRKVQTSFEQIQVQQLAAEAARSQLQAIADSEPVRDRLTPEFLLVKLQAQESLSEALRAHTRAVADYNIALAELAQTTGSVLTLHPVTVPTADAGRR